MLIREASKDDLGQMAELWKEFMDYHRQGDEIFARAEQGHESWAKDALSYVESEQWQVLVAEVDGTLIGYCMATVLEIPPVLVVTRYGKIQDIAVTREYRRQGIGEQLFRRAERWLREQRVERIELFVSVTNPASGAFWRKLGFQDYMECLALPMEAES